MLAKIDFDTNALNTFGEKVGVEYNKSITNSPEGNLIEILGTAKTTHEMWKQYSNEADVVLVQYSTEKSRGIWFINSHNFHIDLEDMSTHILVESYPNLGSTEPYFVTDNLDTIQKYYDEQINDPEHEYVISVTEVKKQDQPEDDGWRYHKWGQFIGDVEPDSEYIYDSNVHDVAYCVHIYEVKKK